MSLLSSSLTIPAMSSESDGAKEVTGEEGNEEAQEANQVLTEVKVSEFLSKAVLRSDAYIGTSDWIVAARRKNDKRAADITFAVPDEHARNFAGDNDRRDLYFYVRIRREAVEEIIGRGR